MNLNKVKSNLTQAMYILATSKEDVRKRLLRAFIEYLHMLEVDDFPPELQKYWRWIHHNMTRYGPVYGYNNRLWEGSYGNTMYRIRKKTGERIASNIFHLWYKLEYDGWYYAEPDSM